MKLSLAFVLLLAALVMVADVGDAAATCDTIRCKRGGYITYKNYMNHKKKLNGCACVCAPKDDKRYVLHYDDDGSTEKCPPKANW